MTDSTKNTLLGVILTSMIAGLGWAISQNSGTQAHLAKIDTILEGHQYMVKDLYSKSTLISPLIEAKLERLNDRITAHDKQIGELQNTTLINTRTIGDIREQVAKH